MKRPLHFYLFIIAAACGATLLGLALIAAIVNGAPVALPEVALGGGLCVLGLLGAIVEVVAWHVARIGYIERDVLIIEQAIGDMQDDIGALKPTSSVLTPHSYRLPGYYITRRDAREKDNE